MLHYFCVFSKETGNVGFNQCSPKPNFHETLILPTAEFLSKVDPCGGKEFLYYVIFYPAHSKKTLSPITVPISETQEKL
jgi:hypothetical protein